MSISGIKARIGGLLLDVYIHNLRKKLKIKTHIHQSSVDIIWDEIRQTEKETIVFLHGFSDQKESFYQTASELAGSCAIIIPDMPGFGQSRHYLNENHNLDRYVSWIKQFIESLPDTKVHLAGNSLGGIIAARLSVVLADKIQSLILINSVGIDLEPYNRFYHQYFQGDSTFLIHTMEDYEAFRKLVFHRQAKLPFGVKEYLADQMIQNRDWYRKLLKDLMPGRSTDEFIRNNPGALLIPLLKKTTMPVYLIWGKEDSIFPVPMAEYAAKEVKHSHLFMLDHVGHCPHLESPRRLAKVLTTIISAQSQKTKT